MLTFSDCVQSRLRNPHRRFLDLGTKRLPTCAPLALKAGTSQLVLSYQVSGSSFPSEVGVDVRDKDPQVKDAPYHGNTT